jgi:hypothetical protein
VETNGISLNLKKKEEKDRKNEKRLMLTGVLWGVGVAAVLVGAFMLGSRGSERAERPSTSVGQSIGGAASDDHDGAGATQSDGASSSRAASDGNGGGDGEPGAVDEGESEATAVPDESTATPTATPDGECQFCPEDVDGFQADPTPTPADPCPLCPDEVDGFQAEPTPVVPCALCVDGGFDAELPELAFTETVVRLCEGFVFMNAETNRNADIWVEYTKEGDDIVSATQFGMEFEEHDTGKWMWFGDWGFLYPYNFHFYAEDSDGNVIEWYEWNTEGCV